jgi:hypothetical protein
MQVCRHVGDLRGAYESVRRLGEANFRDGGLFLEKFIERARHVEVQIFGDGAGQVVVQPGQWSERKAANVNFWWNFSHGMVKNLHLLSFDPQIMTIVFGGLAAINLGFFMKDQIPEWVERVSRFGFAMKERVAACNTLLVIERN